MARWHSLWMTPALPPDLAREVNIDRLVTIGRHQPLAAAAHSIVSLVLAVIYFDLAPAQITICLIGIQLLALVQISIWYHHRNKARPAQVTDRTTNRLLAWAVLWGAVWGVYGAILMGAAPENGRSPICIALVGMAAGGLNMLASLPAASGAYLILSMAPPTFVALRSGQAYGTVLAVCMVLAGVFLALTGRRNYLAFLEHLRLRLGISRLADEAEAASRAKSRFLANMSHELRTPLNAVIGFAEMIHEQIKGPIAPHYLEFAHAIDQSGRHLVEIINDILDLSKIQSGNAALDEAATTIRAIADRAAVVMKPVCQNADIHLIVEIADDMPRIFVDARRMTQVLINLLSNAVTFSAPGEQVRLEACVGPTRAGAPRAVAIRVIDNGVGIPPNEIQEVLKPFVQSREAERRQTPGTGLGLPLSDEIMRMHGGTLRLESELGRGTIVTLTLPPERVVATVQAPVINREIAG